MIRYEELTIGDYVLIDGKVRRVEAITKKKIGYHLRDYARLRDVEPIEINEYIFRTSGFCVENQTKTFLAHFKCDDFKISVIPNSLGCGKYDYILLVDAHGVSNYVELFDFRFVHQLQHAIRICGINFEVKL